MTGPWDADWVSFTTTWSGVFVFLLKFSGSSFESKNLGQSWSFSNITCGADPCWSLVYSLASRTNIFLRMVSYIMWKFLRKVSWSFSWSTVLQRKLAILYQEACWYEPLGRVGKIIYTPIPPIATDASKKPLRHHGRWGVSTLQGGSGRCEFQVEIFFEAMENPKVLKPKKSNIPLKLYQQAIKRFLS